MRWLLRILIVLALLGASGYLGYPYLQVYLKNRNKASYRVAPLVIGDIALVVNSTGTIQPVRRVQVGSFASGPIEKLHVDFNAKVKKKQLLAEIDPRIYKANVERDTASRDTARAEVDRIHALLQQAINDEHRAAQLRAENEDYISDTEMDKFKFNRISLQAQLQVAEAQVKQTEGALKNSEATLEYTKIVAPVDGIVIDRKVDEGQTVASQFQTPEMFVVAPEMEEHMHVFASVDEADVGLIRKAKESNQKVRFTVDAYPDDLFEGTIYQVRWNPTTTQNVVTYTVVVEAPNRELKLLPGMTAKLSFDVEKQEKVLKIPNAALRFFPKPEQVRPDDRPLVEGQTETQLSSEDAKFTEGLRSASHRAEANHTRNRRHVWIEDEANEGLLKAVAITTGFNDHQFTQVLSGDLKEGQQVVTAVKPKTP